MGHHLWEKASPGPSPPHRVGGTLNHQLYMFDVLLYEWEREIPLVAGSRHTRGRLTKVRGTRVCSDMTVILLLQSWIAIDYYEWVGCYVIGHKPCN